MHRIAACEPLEPRRLLAGNLHLADAYVADAQGNRLDTAAAGEVVYLQVEFTTTALEPGASYRVNATLAGRTIGTTIDWGAGDAETRSWVLRSGAWLLGAGASSASIVLDAATAIEETNESDNARGLNIVSAVFAPKFVKPIAGEMGAGWALTSLVDIDPSTECRDLTGGAYCADGHDGWDLTLANFHAMDRGHAVIAAATGTVLEVGEGQFDRNTTGAAAADNFIIIDHGNGWRTAYRHLRRDSVLVDQGDPVTAGQPLALVGSSGASTDAHLHWSVTYNNRPVEPMVAPEQYLLWTQPHPSTLPAILDAGITSYDPAPEMKERPARAEYFRTAGGETVHFWMRTAGFRNGDELSVRWLRPDGSEHRSDNWVTGVTRYGGWVAMLTLPAGVAAGTWRAVAMINGVEKAAATFEVLATSRPQARLLDGTAYFVDGRSTPFNFGAALEGQTTPPPTRTFTVRNSGAATLTTSNLTVPTGYSIAEPLAASIPPGGADTFTLRLDALIPGRKAGVVTFQTNDPSPGEDVLDFTIEGDVTSVTDAIAELLTEGDDAVYIGRSGALAQIWINRDTALTPSLETAVALMPTAIDSRGGDDAVTLDFTAGAPLSPTGMTINSGAGNDTLRIIGTSAADAFTLAGGLLTVAGTPLTLTDIHRLELEARDGADTFTIDPGSLAIAEVAIFGGNQGDTLFINDEANQAPDVYQLTSTTFDKDAFGSLEYSELESLILNAGGGANRIEIDSTPAMLATTVRGGGGDDDIQVATGDLIAILGAVSIDGQAGSDRLTIDDHESGSTAQITLAPAAVSRDSSGSISYSNIEALTLDASQAASTLLVLSTSPGVPVTLRPNAGADIIRINETHPSAPVTIGPSTGDDSVSINPDGAGSASVLFPDTTILGALTIFTGGRASLLPAGDHVIRTTALTLLGNARLDLTDNALIVDGGSLNQVRNAIASARNTAPLWQGPGLATSSAAPTQTLAVVHNDRGGAPFLSALNGLAVDADDILVRFTLTGDSDLDGDVDISDFFAIDQGRALRKTGYANGDFDYDNGVADADDFMRIDRAFLSQGTPLGPAPGASVNLFDSDLTHPAVLGSPPPAALLG